MISPLQVEVYLKRIEMRLATTLASISNASTYVITAFFLSGMLSILKIGEDGGHFLYYGGFFVVQLVAAGISIAILMSLFTLFIGPRYQAIIQILVLVVTWLTSYRVHFENVSQPAIALMIICSVPAYSIMGWYYLNQCKNPRHAKSGAVIFSAAFWLISLSIVALLWFTENYKALEVYWRLRTEFIWLMVLSSGLSQTPTESEAMIALGPVNALRGSLWPLGSILLSSPVERRKNWWQGILNLLVGYTTIEVRMLLERHVLVHIHAPFLHHSFKYILAVTALISVLNILTGVMRLMGYRVPDATFFVWLARSPIEYWRRGAVYHYLFVMREVYPRIMRRFRKRWIAVMGAFVFFLFMKGGLLNLILFAANQFEFDVSALQSNVSRTESTLIMWTLWFLLLILTQRRWIFSRQQLNRAGIAWLSILTTHVCMASLYYFSHVLYGMLPPL